MVAELKKKTNRVLFLDIIRGLAAVAVMCEHVFLHFNKEHYFTTASSIFNLGIFGVVSFFLVSGFIIPFSLERYKSIKVFFLNRIFRIYPVYIVIFFILLILCFFEIIPNWNLLQGKVILNFVYALFFLQDYIPARFGAVNLVGGAWTLFIELVWYIIFAITYHLRINKWHFSLIVAGNVIVLLFTLLSLLYGFKIPVGRPILLLCCFWGLFIYRYFSREISINAFFIFSIVTLVNIYSALYVGYGKFPNKYYSVNCVLITYSSAFLFFFICYLFDGKINSKLQSLVGFFGNISYSLYLGHGIVLEILWSRLSNGYASIFIVITLSVALAYFIHIYIENPGVALGKKIIKLLVKK